MANLNVNKDAVIYFNDDMISAYFNIVGINSSIFYTFVIFKIMILSELYSKYKNLKVKIIRENFDRSYFTVSCWCYNKNTKEELFSEIRNIIDNAELYIEYSKKCIIFY